MGLTVLFYYHILMPTWLEPLSTAQSLRPGLRTQISQVLHVECNWLDKDCIKSLDGLYWDRYR